MASLLAFLNPTSSLMRIVSLWRVVAGLHAIVTGQKLSHRPSLGCGSFIMHVHNCCMFCLELQHSGSFSYEEKVILMICVWVSSLVGAVWRPLPLPSSDGVFEWFKQTSLLLLPTLSVWCLFFVAAPAGGVRLRRSPCGFLGCS